MTDFTIFDSSLRSIHRSRAAKINSNHDFLVNEVSARLLETLEDEVNRKFPDILDIGSRSPLLQQTLAQNPETKMLIISDISCNTMANGKSLGICLEEEMLPFKENSFDLIISALNLHWVNDLPGCLIQIRKMLKDKGLFLASIFGGNTLHELRTVMAEVETEYRNGLSPRVSPFVDTKDAAALLQRAGFKLPVVDADEIKTLYSGLGKLVEDLRGMGETNALLKRPAPLTKRMVKDIEQNYRKKFGDVEGLIPATFNIITLTGWKS